VIEAQGGEIHFFAGIWQARQLLRALQPGVVQGWMYYGNFLALLISPLGSKTAWNIRSTMSRNYPFKIRCVIGLSRFMTPDLVLYNAHAGQQSHGFFNSGSTQVIPNGIDTQIYAPSEAGRASVRESLGWGDSAVVIAMVTRFHPDKGVGEFLHMVKSLQAAGHPVRKFVLIGRGMSADNPKLQAVLAEVGVSEMSVQLLGERRDMVQIYAALDVLVVASYREGSPNVMLEAMSSGVTVVGTDVGDVAKIVADGQRVFLAADQLALTQAVAFAVAHKGEFALRDRQRIVDEYDSERCHQAYKAMYIQLTHTDI
jgi:glycosyltransferase involved in cell wall biosynthesis